MIETGKTLIVAIVIAVAVAVAVCTDPNVLLVRREGGETMPIPVLPIRKKFLQKNMIHPL
jgi:hypothetical protein